MKQLTNKTIGLTLIELVITLGIMVLLLATSIPAFKFFGRASELTQTAEEVRSMAVSAYNDSLAPRQNKLAGADIYELVIDQNSRRVKIQEKNGDQVSVIEEYQLPSGYTLENISPSGQVLEIDFSIPGQAKIVSVRADGVESQVPEIQFIIKSQSLNPPDNQKIITIDRTTGMVRIK